MNITTLSPLISQFVYLFICLFVYFIDNAPKVNKPFIC